MRDTIEHHRMPCWRHLHCCATGLSTDLLLLSDTLKHHLSNISVGSVLGASDTWRDRRVVKHIELSVKPQKEVYMSYNLLFS